MLIQFLVSPPQFSYQGDMASTLGTSSHISTSTSLASMQ